MLRKKLDLSKLGGFEKYVAKFHEVTSVNPIVSERAVLKFYSMRSVPKEPFSRENMDAVEGFIRERLLSKEIDSESGLGFTIVSDGYINVALWDAQTLSILRNSLYGFTAGSDNIKRIERLDIRDAGAYCAWELGVVAHEAEAWRKYLWSQRKEEHRLRYVEDVFRGMVA